MFKKIQKFFKPTYGGTPLSVLKPVKRHSRKHRKLPHPNNDFDNSFTWDGLTSPLFYIPQGESMNETNRPIPVFALTYFCSLIGTPPPYCLGIPAGVEPNIEFETQKILEKSGWINADRRPQGFGEKLATALHTNPEYWGTIHNESITIEGNKPTVYYACYTTNKGSFFLTRAGLWVTALWREKPYTKTEIGDLLTKWCFPTTIPKGDIPFQRMSATIPQMTPPHKGLKPIERTQLKHLNETTPLSSFYLEKENEHLVIGIVDPKYGAVIYLFKKGASGDPVTHLKQWESKDLSKLLTSN